MNASMELQGNVSERFYCFRGNLSRDDITDEAWSLGDDHDQKQGAIVVASILALLMLVGIPWNLAVLVALIYNKFFKQPSTFLLFNLALVDFLTCVLVVPFHAVPGLLGGEYNLGSSDYRRCQSCRAGVIMIVWLLYMSIHIIAVMSVDRLIYIKKPIDYKKWITVPRMAMVLSVLWIFCFILATPPLFQFGAIEFSQVVGTCSVVYFSQTKYGISYFYVIFLLVEAAIPLGVMVIANIWLLYFAVKILRINHEAKQKYHNKQLRMLKIFGSIFISNFVTWAPSILAVSAIGAVGLENIPAEVFSLVFLSFLSQSVIHPMLESCLVRKVRKLMKKVFCSCCPTRMKRTTDTVRTSTAMSLRNTDL